MSTFKFEPEDFTLERTSVWSFPERGAWATHGQTAKYRGNFSPYIPRNVISRFSQPGDIVFDPFCGAGTTGVEAKLLGRRCLLADINPNAVEITRTNLDFKVPEIKSSIPRILLADARYLQELIPDEQIDLICTHPPYCDAIKYSKDLAGDLSLMHDLEEFLAAMQLVGSEFYRVLKSKAIAAVLMGDIRRQKRVVPLGFKVMQVFEEEGFVLQDIVLKVQHNCRTTKEWEAKARKLNFLLLMHEYLFIFQKK